MKNEPRNFYRMCVHSCELGDISSFRKFLVSLYRFHGSHPLDADNFFYIACCNGHLPIVHFLLCGNPVIIPIDISDRNYEGFRVACRNGHLGTVRYLLTAPELIDHADIHAQSNYGLRKACVNGHLDVVRYLLTSPELKEHALIDSDDGAPLPEAFSGGHMDVIKYLLFSPELKKRASLIDGFQSIMRSITMTGEPEMFRFMMESPEIQGLIPDDHFFYTDSYQNTLASFAIGRGHIPLLSYILHESPFSHMVDVDSVVVRNALKKGKSYLDGGIYDLISRKEAVRHISTMIDGNQTSKSSGQEAKKRQKTPWKI